jgi:hypothetical protein
MGIDNTRDRRDQSDALPRFRAPNCRSPSLMDDLMSDFSPAIQVGLRVIEAKCT